MEKGKGNVISKSITRLKGLANLAQWEKHKFRKDKLNISVLSLLDLPTLRFLL